jgi:hypothetical protein
MHSEEGIEIRSAGIKKYAEALGAVVDKAFGNF